jgi:hypothetical protein
LCPVEYIWTQTIEYTVHWETLLFENVKNYFTIIAASLGAAGAVMAWSVVPRTTQIIVICFFLVSALVISGCAIMMISSTQRYLARLYNRRHELEKPGGLKLILSPEEQEKVLPRPPEQRKDKTVWSLRTSFYVAIALAFGLLIVALATPEVQHLDLSGADLSPVRNLAQRDLESACGDATTKLPPGLVLSPCAP